MESHLTQRQESKIYYLHRDSMAAGNASSLHKNQLRSFLKSRFKSNYKMATYKIEYLLGLILLIKIKINRLMGLM